MAGLSVAGSKIIEATTSMKSKASSDVKNKKADHCQAAQESCYFSPEHGIQQRQCFEWGWKKFWELLF